MSDLYTMKYYMESVVYLAVACVSICPFLSFFIQKISANRWLQRIYCLLILLGGWYLLCNRQNDPLFFILMGAISISYLLYQLISDKLNGIKKRWRTCLEIIPVTGFLFISLYIIAVAGNFPVSEHIIERFPDGSYTFFPGYWDDMFQIAVTSAILLICSKYLYLYLNEKNRQNEQKRKEKEIKETLLQKELIQAQLDTLQAKVNPHFLYNSLNTIAGLALVDAEKTRQMALALSRFFRYSMNKEQTNLIRITEEIEMVRTYLEIEKIRFGKLLDYKIDLSPECKEQLIPRMLLQPLVENCIKHGWKGEQEVILIQILIKRDNNKLILSIRDNGAPFPAEFIPGYGLKSTYDKLELLLPDQYEVEIITKPEKEVRVSIHSFLLN